MTTPPTHLEMLTMVRLADYVGVDYLEAAAKWLDVGVHSILNGNPVASRPARVLLKGLRVSKEGKSHCHQSSVNCSQAQMMKIL